MQFHDSATALVSRSFALRWIVIAGIIITLLLLLLTQVSHDAAASEHVYDLRAGWTRHTSSAAREDSQYPLRSRVSLEPQEPETIDVDVTVNGKRIEIPTNGTTRSQDGNTTIRVRTASDSFGDSDSSSSVDIDVEIVSRTSGRDGEQQTSRRGARIPRR